MQAGRRQSVTGLAFGRARVTVAIEPPLQRRFAQLRAALPPPPGRKVTDPTAWRPYRSRGCDAFCEERAGSTRLPKASYSPSTLPGGVGELYIAGLRRVWRGTPRLDRGHDSYARGA